MKADLEKTLASYPVAVEYSIKVLNSRIREFEDLLAYTKQAKEVIEGGSKDIYDIEALTEQLTLNYREEYSDLQEMYEDIKKGKDVPYIEEQEGLTLELDQFLSELRYIRSKQ